MPTEFTPTEFMSMESAPAKINLTLRIRGRRADGYHDLESLVVFAGIGDEVRLRAGMPLALDVQGETAVSSGPVSDNLILKAARRLLAENPGLQAGHFELRKSLPVAAGLGGGSSDAAAALRLIARANTGKIAPGDAGLTKAARDTGADVAVCLDPRPRIMRGTGDVLSHALHLPKLPAVLVNPRIAVPTAEVFAARARDLSDAPQAENDPATTLCESATSEARKPPVRDLIEALLSSGNDLETAAISLHPVIADTIKALRALSGCRLARMSGSGATCFAIFDDTRAAHQAARDLQDRHPAWWTRTVTLG